MRAPPHAVAVSLLLTLFAGLAVGSMRGESATFDETAHLAAGVSYWHRGDFRLNPEHPPLAKAWASLLLAGRADDRPDYSSTAWKSGDQWRFGFEYLNGSIESAERRDPRRRLFLGRLPMVVLGVLLGLVVYGWAREMWGPPGALIALFLFALSPTLLAHSRLVTTDVPAALGFALSLWCLWRFFRRPGPARILLLGAAFGAALLLKYSMVLLGPIFLLLMVLWAFPPGEPLDGWRRRLRLGAGALLAASLVAWALVWLAYGFRYSASPDPGYAIDWRQAGSSSGMFSLLRRAHLLPEGYLYGFAYSSLHAGRAAFLNGTIHPEGSWLFFPEAFLLKTTPALLVLLVVLGWRIVRDGRGLPVDVWFLAMPAAIYFVVAIGFRLNIGHRHLLPLYPLLLVFSGGAARFLEGPSPKRLLLAAVLASQAVSGLSAYPGYLSYFNLLAGGRGWKCLVDSNCDWGQDLPRLKEWMDAQGVAELHLAYFGTADPEATGIRYRKIYQYMEIRPGAPSSLPGPGSWVAVSVTLLQGLYVFDASSARFLRELLERHAPVARAGDSIFIYRLP